MSLRPALLGLFLPGAWLLWGCGGGVARSGTDTPSGSAGSAGTGGSTDAAGSVGTNGGAGSVSNPACAVQPLSEYCRAPQRCPAGPDAVPLNCGGSFLQTTRSATACGGTVVEATYGLGSNTWYFDANGKLVGLRIQSDTGPICGTEYGVTTYGMVCEAVGEPRDLCIEACTDQAPLMTDGVTLTESNYDFVSHCSEAATDVIKSPTVCGGTVYLIRREEYGTSETYCFDEAGRLIGSINYDEQGAPVIRGAMCKPTNAEERLCTPT